MTITKLTKMKSKVINTLFFEKLKLSLFTDPEEYNKHLTKLGYQADAVNNEGCAAFVNQCALVFVAYNKPENVKDLAYLQSVLTHEASHIVDDIFDAVGETNPGTETRAYLIEKITLGLFELYFEERDSDFMLMPRV